MSQGGSGWRTEHATWAPVQPDCAQGVGAAADLNAPPPPQYHQQGYGSVYRTALGRAFASYSPGERKDIQRELRRYGYYHGRVDGQFGPGTYDAVSAYARRTGQRDANRSMAAAFGVYDSLLY